MPYQQMNGMVDAIQRHGSRLLATDLQKSVVKFFLRL
jgi:hypothetical protein